MGATTNDVFEYELSLDFNPRSPWGERHEVPPGSPEGAGISIHTPHIGSDIDLILFSQRLDISIHAPRRGSDAAIDANIVKTKAISIHAPRRGSDFIYPSLTFSA